MNAGASGTPAFVGRFMIAVIGEIIRTTIMRRGAERSRVGTCLQPDTEARVTHVTRALHILSCYLLSLHLF